MELLKLSDLRQLSNEELLEKVNAVGQSGSRSSAATLTANGLDMSWAELITIAKYRGLVQVNQSCHDKKIEYRLGNEASSTLPDVIYIAHGKRSATKKKPLTLSISTLELYRQLFEVDEGSAPIGNTIKSRILDEILRQSLIELLKRKKNGTLRIEYEPLRDNRII